MLATLVQTLLMTPPEDTIEIYNGQSKQIPKLPMTSNSLPFSSFFPHHLKNINLEKKG